MRDVEGMVKSYDGPRCRVGLGWGIGLDLTRTVGP